MNTIKRTIVLLLILCIRTIIAGQNIINTGHNQSQLIKAFTQQPLFSYLIHNWQYPRGGVPGLGRAFTQSPLFDHSDTNSKLQQSIPIQNDVTEENNEQKEARFAFDTYEIALIKKWKDIIKKNPTIKDELLDFEKHIDRALKNVSLMMEQGQEYNPIWFENSKRYRSKNIHLRDLIESYLTKHLGAKIVFSPNKFKNPLLFTEDMGSKHVPFSSQYLIDREKLERLKDIIFAIKNALRFNNFTTFQP